MASPVGRRRHIRLAGERLQIRLTALCSFDMFQVESQIRKRVQQFLNGSLLSNNLWLITAQFDCLVCAI